MYYIDRPFWGKDECNTLSMTNFGRFVNISLHQKRRFGAYELIYWQIGLILRKKLVTLALFFLLFFDHFCHENDYLALKYAIARAYFRPFVDTIITYNQVPWVLKKHLFSGCKQTKCPFFYEVFPQKMPPCTECLE